jgi:hypothetical protein
MIIKVPIYVEFSKPLNPETLSDDIIKLSEKMGKVLRTYSTSSHWQDFETFKDQKFEKAKIIQRSRALDALRKGK